MREKHQIRARVLNQVLSFLFPWASRRGSPFAGFATRCIMLGKSNSGMPFYPTGRPRRKIESDPQQPKHILSMPGVGYRLLLTAGSE